MSADPWLDRWLPLLSARVGDRPVLELGCGSGRDTESLVAAGRHVVARDLASSALAEARARAPACEFHCQDMRAPFPASAARVNVVVASLSLHYFAWNETVILVNRIREALKPSGVLFCRLNSTEDHFHGASGHPPLEQNYYLVDGKPKRFFERASVEALFASGWNVLHLEHRVVRRYAHPKALWEVIVERAA